jgi:hypothetical protein
MRLEKGKAAIYDMAFLRFMQEEIRKEAEELDTARITLRIENHALIVSEQRTPGTPATIERHDYCLGK